MTFLRPKRSDSFTSFVCQTIIERLERDFDPEVAKSMDAVIQYPIPGEDGGDYKIMIKDSMLKIEKGIHDSLKSFLRLEKK